MQIAFHIGVHCTDDDRLLRCLLRNKGRLVRDGVIVPGPGRYRRLIRATVNSLDGRPASEATREALLDAIIDEDSAERLVLSNENFVCNIPRIFEDQLLYGLIEEKVVGLANLFPDAEVEFLLAVRNPATLLPALSKRADDRSYQQLMQGTDPASLHWSEVVESIRAAVPRAAVTVWANEDTPLIWSEVLRKLAGIDAEVPLSGTDALLENIMTREGLRRFNTYLMSHPPQSEFQRRRIIAAFLDKFAIADRIEEELDIPGWTNEYVEALTDIYEEDLLLIQRMQGVDFIEP